MNFKIRNSNSKIIAVLIAVLFLFSLFPGYGVAEENQQSPSLLTEMLSPPAGDSETPGNQGGNQEGTTNTPGDSDVDPQEDPEALDNTIGGDVPPYGDPQEIGDNPQDNLPHVELEAENPDHLNGPEEILAPIIQYPTTISSKIFKKSVRSSDVELLNRAATNELEPGQVELSKLATPVTGTDNQWQVTLTINGKDMVQTSSADIVLLIDRSASMSGARMTNAKAAATYFVNELLKEGNISRRIAIVSFSSNVSIDSGNNANQAFKGASEKQTLLNAINGLNANDGTFTQAGLKQAQALLDASTATNKFIVLLSDGEPTYSYEINTPDNYLEYWKTETKYLLFIPYKVDLYKTNESVPENAYVNNTVGSGNSGYYNYNGNNYYSHGNSAISQSKFAKAKAHTIYTIALEAGTEGDRVLNGIASPGKAYTGSLTALDDMFGQIASDIIKYAANDVTVIDPMADKFSIPGITAANYKEKITVNQGTISWDNDTETITWTIPYIAESKPATMTYIVEIDDGIASGEYPTNKETTMSYTDVNGNHNSKDFPIPQVQITDTELAYTVKYFVDSEVQTEWQESGTVLASNPQLASVPNKTPAGYMLDTINSTALPFTVTLANNVINVYYVKDSSQWNTVTFIAGANGTLTGTTSFTNILDGTAWADAVTVPTPVADTGYKFDSWSADFPSNVTESATYTANFVKDDSQWYTVTFAAGANGNLTGATSFANILTGTAWADAVTVPTPVAALGYKFDSWSPALPGANDKVTENKTFTAIFTLAGGGTTGGGGGSGGGGTTSTPTTTPTTPSEVVVEPEAPLVSLNKEDHYAYMVGYPDNTFRPEGKVTREEVATVFYKLLDEQSRTGMTTKANNFSDLEVDRWSCTPIATLAAASIITGYEDGTFRPGNVITRAELATIASKFDNLSPFESNKFSDVAGHWANTFINSAAQKGWVNGYEDGTFKPEQAITRAEFATLVNNVLDRRVKKENILPDAKQFSDLNANAWYYEACQEAINSHYYERENPSDFEVWTELYEFTISW